MKKNITINMRGRLFAIDEDAYELVKQYLDALHSHFGKTGESEVPDDIEERIAELFQELKGRGQEAITIEDVTAIIDRVGHPEQLMDESDEDGARTHDGADEDGQQSHGKAASTAGKIHRRMLFRDTKDCVVAGVISGLAHYFRIDTRQLRKLVVGVPIAIGLFFALLMMLFTEFEFPAIFVSLATLVVLPARILVTVGIVYAILAFLMPVADTPEKLLSMRGEEVTPQHVAEELKRGSHAGSMATGGMQRLADNVFRFLGNCAKAVGVVTGLLLGAAFVLFLLMYIGMLLQPGLGTLDWMHIDFVLKDVPILAHLFCAALLACLFIPAYAIGHAILAHFGRVSRMGLWQRMLWTVGWLVVFVGAFLLSFRVYKLQDEKMEAYDRKLNTHNGVYIRPDEWKYLQDGNWQLLKHEECNDRYTYVDEFYDGSQRRFLDVYNDKCRQVFQVERTDTVPNGLYRLSAVARAEGRGGCIYALASEKRMAEIPAYGNEGGELWQAAFDADKESAQARVNKGHGKGWSRVVVDSVRVTDGTVRYGVSTDPKFTGCPFASKYVSVGDFALERIE